MIYTTYFANLKRLRGVTPIAICAKPPVGYTGLCYKQLAPPYATLVAYKDTLDQSEYIKSYNQAVLSRLDPSRVVRELSALSQTKDFALVCYEKPDAFCHRHLVREWLIQNGFECEEYPNQTHNGGNNEQ